MRVLQAIIAPVGITEEELAALIGEELGKTAVDNLKSAQKSAGETSQKWTMFDEGQLVPGSMDVRPLAAKREVMVLSGKPKEPESEAAKAATPIAEDYESFVGSPEDKFRSAFFEHMWAFMDLASATMSLEGDAKTRLKTLLPYWKKINDFLKESVEMLGTAAVKMQAPGLVDAAIYQIRELRAQMISDLKSIVAGEPIVDGALTNSDGEIETGDGEMEIDYKKLAAEMKAMQDESEAAKAAEVEKAAAKEAELVDKVTAKVTEQVAESIGAQLTALNEKLDGMKSAETTNTDKPDPEAEATKAAEIKDLRERLHKLENSTVSSPSSPDDPPVGAAEKAAVKEAHDKHPCLSLWN